jgi:hypothetical protein
MQVSERSARDAPPAGEAGDRLESCWEWQGPKLTLRLIVF